MDLRPHSALTGAHRVMKPKKIALAAGAALLVAIIVVVGIRISRRGVVTVQTGGVVRQDLVSVVTASGEIKPLNYVNINATAFGRITNILVREGDAVQKGQLLARLESVQPSAEVEAQRASLRASEADAAAAGASVSSAEAAQRTAEADLLRAQAELEKARLEFQRAEALFGDQLISKSQFDAARAAYEVALAVVAQTEARLAQTRALVEQARSQRQTARTRIGQFRAGLRRASDVLHKHSFYAPLDGVVTDLPVHVGESVVIGIQNSPGSLLMTIAELSVITAEVKVDETDIVNVRLGQSAEVTVDAFPNQTFQGKVTEIGTSAIIRSTGRSAAQSNVASQEAKDFKVVVILESPPDNLRPGLSTTAKIRTASKKNVLTIPIQALTIRQKSDLKEGQKKGSSSDAALAAGPEARQREKEGKKEIQGVFVVRDKRVQFVPVETGIIGSTDIEVLKGLEEGKEIVTGSYKVLRTIRNQAPVRVDNREPKRGEQSW